MPDLPVDWGALCAIVFLLGLRHGFDADHLAAVDAMTRVNAGRRGACWCGLLFACGHGAVVLAIAGAMAGARERWALPGWLDAAGAVISIALLLALAVANLRALLAAPSGAPFAPVAVKGRWFAGRRVRPAGAVVVGALFAISFDTLSQAALFGLTAMHHGGIAPALVLGALFAAGMALVDGADGLWVARLQRQAAVSRAVGWAVVVVTLGTASFGAARLLFPLKDAGLAQSAAMTALVAASWLLASWLARRRASRPPAPA